MPKRLLESLESSDESEPEVEAAEDTEEPDVSPVVQMEEVQLQTKSKTTKTRRSTATSRLLNSFMKEEQFKAEMKDKKVHVKCNQTGKTFKAKVTALSKENAEPIVSLCDLAEGAELFLDVNDKSYPVTVIKVVDESKSYSKPKKHAGECSGASIPQLLTEVVESRKKQTDESNQNSSKAKKKLTQQQPVELEIVLDNAKKSFENSGDSGVEDSVASSSTPSNGSTPRTHTHRIGSNREVVSLLLKMDSTLNTLVDITKKLTAEGGVKKEDDPKYTVNGINLLMIPARDAYAYGRSLLEVLFSKEVLARSVVIKSIKSHKPPLDPELVQLIFDCVRFRYPDYDHCKMMSSLGQKCRDSGRE